MTQQLIRNYDEQKLMMWGQPFLFSVATTGILPGYASATEITLDGTDFDLDGNGIVETTPFYGQLLVITGIRIINTNVGGGNVFGGWQVDGWRLLSGGTTKTAMLVHAVGNDIYIDGMNTTTPTSAAVLSAPFKNVFGTTGVVCRYGMKVWAAATAGGDTTTIWFKGVSMLRNL